MTRKSEESNAETDETAQPASEEKSPRERLEKVERGLKALYDHFKLPQPE